MFTHQTVQSRGGLASFKDPPIRLGKGLDGMLSMRESSVMLASITPFSMSHIPSPGTNDFYHRNKIYFMKLTAGIHLIRLICDVRIHG